MARRREEISPERSFRRPLFLGRYPQGGPVASEDISAHGTNRTISDVRRLVAIGGKADVARMPNSVENDPDRTFRAKRTGHPVSS
jgi:hypothetical protein